jgi:hypothetical protein
LAGRGREVEAAWLRREALAGAANERSQRDEGREEKEDLRGVDEAVSRDRVGERLSEETTSLTMPLNAIARPAAVACAAPQAPSARPRSSGRASAIDAVKVP